MIPATTITYPPDLPVSQRRDDIARAIRANQVVIVAGETGSGKTTQLPKILLELGYSSIGHTQPRRIAARTIAERIAEELGSELGGLVGYRVRFTDQVGKDTRIKLMTDGILLNELQRDRTLKRYDAIIIDEAHERSLTIDFLIGYLKQLLPRRPDLKVVITSATIDPESFAKHFADAAGEPAPIVEVSGRTYPVEVRYRPLVAEDVPEALEGTTTTSTMPPSTPFENLRGRATATTSRASTTHSTSCRRRRRATCSCSSRARPRSGMPPTPSAVATCPTPRCSRSTAACPPRSSTACSARRPRAPAAGSCSPRTSPRRA